MDKITFSRLIFVTIPENILNIYLVFLMTGERLKLPFRDNPIHRKKNTTKLVITVFLFSVIQVVGRMLFKDMVSYLIANVILSVITIRVVYGDKVVFNKQFIFSENIVNFLKSFKIATIQVFLIIAFLLTIEGIYLPIVLQTLNLSLEDTFLPEYKWLNLLLPQIDRFFQLLLISIFWNFSRVKNNILQYSCKRPLYLTAYIYIIIIEFSFVYTYIKSFINLSFATRVLFSLLCISMCISNIVCFRLLTSLIDKVHKKHIERGVTIED